jgi:hypothetical protein
MVMDFPLSAGPVFVQWPKVLVVPFDHEAILLPEWFFHRSFSGGKLRHLSDIVDFGVLLASALIISFLRQCAGLRYG